MLNAEVKQLDEQLNKVNKRLARLRALMNQTNGESQKSSKVEIIGIGAKLIDVNGSCTIAELIPGGPAEKSQQLEPKDVILKVSAISSIIKVSSDGTASISLDHRIDGKRFQHSEVLDSNATFEQTINGHHFEVRDGNVKYNGQEIARPEGSTLKIIEKAPQIFIYIDDKLIQEIRINE